MNINMKQSALYSGIRSASGQSHLNVKNSYYNSYMKQKAGQGIPCASAVSNEDPKTSSLRKLQSEMRQQDKYTDFYSKYAESSANYAKSVRASGTQKKKTAAKLKKLRYNFKSISSQIIKSKTSMNAKQVASKAKREVVKLRQKQMSGEYDSEEVQIAIAHAEKIERVAKKKVKHLEEEERVKVTGGPCEADLEEQEEEKGASKTEKAENAIAAMENGMSGADAAKMQQQQADLPQERMQYIQEQLDAMQDMMQERMRAMQDMMQAQMEAMQKEMQASMEQMQKEMQAKTEEMMGSFMDEMEQSMKELLEDSGLSDLMEEMMGGSPVEMDPADYEMMKLKHRAKEMKEIAEADAEYLKAVFDRMEKMKDAMQQGIGGSDNHYDAAAGMSPAGGAVIISESHSTAEYAQEFFDTDNIPADTGGCGDASLSGIGGSIDCSI